jgi:hypothetical protein
MFLMVKSIIWQLLVDFSSANWQTEKKTVLDQLDFFSFLTEKNDKIAVK